MCGWNSAKIDFKNVRLISLTVLSKYSYAHGSPAKMRPLSLKHPPSALLSNNKTYLCRLFFLFAPSINLGPGTLTDLTSSPPPFGKQDPFNACYSFFVTRLELLSLAAAAALGGKRFDHHHRRRTAAGCKRDLRCEIRTNRQTDRQTTVQDIAILIVFVAIGLDLLRVRVSVGIKK